MRTVTVVEKGDRKGSPAFIQVDDVTSQLLPAPPPPPKR